jgi:hypothetical protein
MKMGNQNSQSGDYYDVATSLSINCLIDIATQCGCDHVRDANTILRRSSYEGMSFLTKTLPSLGKQIIASLNNETPLQISGFKLRRRSCIPRFLGDYISRVFRDDGYVRDDYDYASLNDVVQLTQMFYKTELPYAKEIEMYALQKYMRTEASLPINFNHFGGNRLERLILEEARDTVRSLFRDFDPLDIVPRHGPGAVAESISQWEKYAFRTIFSPAEEIFPATDYFYVSEKHRFDEWDRLDAAEYTDISVSRTLFVPKDSRGPRTISCEPVSLQYLQQGLSRSIVDHVERHPMTRGKVNFTNQGVNQFLALRSSVSRQWATIDLQEASDRVSCALVKELFSGVPELYNALMALRSTHTELPISNQVVKLNKFAPMGSALCFPIEAVCFWALSTAIISVHCDRKMAPVYVYGDDIIVRSQHYKAVVGNLHYFGLRVNLTKCCIHGYFRESCGVDAYHGEIIKPVRVKTLSYQCDGTSYVRLMDLSNALFYKCYYRAAAYVSEYIRVLFNGTIPISKRDPHEYKESWQILPGSLTLQGFVPAQYVRVLPDEHSTALKKRYNRNLQRTELLVRTITPLTVTPRGLSPWLEMLRSLTTGLQQTRVIKRTGGKPPLHRPTYTVRSRVKLNLRWTSADNVC